MISRSEINNIKSLHHKKQRNEQQLFIAETPKVVAEILHSEYIVEKIYATENWLNTSKNHVPTTIITQQQLAQISTLQTPHQVLAVVKMKEENIETLNFSHQLTLALDNIQDPGNLGTIIRIADWFGIRQIVCSLHCVDVFNPKVVQSTMGSFSRVKIYYAHIAQVLQNVAMPVYGAMLQGEDVRKIDKPHEAILIIGNEANGISPEVEALITQKISIEKVGNAESLNAAVATGILVSHLVR